MMKAAKLCAPLAVAAAALTMSGAAFAQDIGCVDGIPAPPITQSCPSTGLTGAFAQAPGVRYHVPKHRAHVARNAMRHVD